MKNLFFLLILLWCLTACKAFNRNNPLLTLEAESISYAAEATTIRQTADFERTSVQVTAQAAETQVALVNGVNAQLRGTLGVNLTPTVSIVSMAEPMNPVSTTVNGEPMTTGGETQYVITGTSTATDQATGCVVSPQSAFPSTASMIYATAQAFNLKTGTVLRGEWSYEGTPRYDYEWTVEQDYSDLCIWFFIDPSITAFTPGGWSVQLYANGSPIQNPMQFIIEEAQ